PSGDSVPTLSLAPLESSARGVSIGYDAGRRGAGGVAVPFEDASDRPLTPGPAGASPAPQLARRARQPVRSQAIRRAHECQRRTVARRGGAGREVWRIRGDAEIVATARRIWRICFTGGFGVSVSHDSIVRDSLRPEA